MSLLLCEKKKLENITRKLIARNPCENGEILDDVLFLNKITHICFLETGLINAGNDQIFRPLLYTEHTFKGEILDVKLNETEILQSSRHKNSTLLLSPQ